MAKHRTGGQSYSHRPHDVGPLERIRLQLTWRLRRLLLRRDWGRRRLLALLYQDHDQDDQPDRDGEDHQENDEQDQPFHAAGKASDQR
jgi:hypothetical protein